jgi:catechol 2,3-dioxygenase-like lactoylglutathione lyase family enzyme
MKLAAVRLFVRDLAAARDFYAAQLGLHLQHDGSADGFCVFDVDGIDLVVEAVPADAPADEQALVGRFSGMSFAVGDIAAAYARMVAAGVPFGGPPQLQFWGGTLATLSDPAGNELQLVQYPAAVPAP